MPAPSGKSATASSVSAQVSFSLSIEIWSNHELHILCETVTLHTCDCFNCSKWLWQPDEGGQAPGQSPSPSTSLWWSYLEKRSDMALETDS